MTLVWGSNDTDDDAYFDPDPYRHDAVGWDLASGSWERTLAAMDGDAGVAIYGRAALADDAWWHDWDLDAMDARRERE